MRLLSLAHRVVEGPTGETVHAEFGVALDIYEYEIIFCQLETSKCDDRVKGASKSRLHLSSASNLLSDLEPNSFIFLVKALGNP